jgi:hypothetical protein
MNAKTSHAKINTHRKPYRLKNCGCCTSKKNSGCLDDNSYHFCWRILKKYSTSSTPSSTKSVQCTAFLILSRPKFARIDFGRIARARSGSCGPHNSLKELTTLSWRISKAMHGPVVSSSAKEGNSGTTPLYTSRNYSAVGLSSQNICIALISNPSDRMKSMMAPVRPSAII